MGFLYNDNIVKNKGDSFNKKSSNKQKQLKQLTKQ